METLKLLQGELVMSRVVLSGLTSADIYCRACSYIFQEPCDVDQGMHCILSAVSSVFIVMITVCIPGYMIWKSFSPCVSHLYFVQIGWVCFHHVYVKLEPLDISFIFVTAFIFCLSSNCLTKGELTSYCGTA